MCWECERTQAITIHNKLQTKDSIALFGTAHEFICLFYYVQHSAYPDLDDICNESTANWLHNMHARDIWSWSPYLHWHQNDFRINLKRIIFNIMSRLNAFFFFFFAAAFFLSIFCGYKLKKEKNLKIVCAIDDDEILVFLDIFMSAWDMNFLEQLKITMANLMGIDDDSQNKKNILLRKIWSIRKNDATKIQKKDHMDDMAAVIGSDFNFAMSQWIRSAFTKSTTTQIRRHVQINQSCVISASLRMFHFGWIFLFFHSVSRGDFYRVVNIFKFYAFRIRSRSRKRETHTR